MSIFPTVGNTESPDRFSAKILEGRVEILVTVIIAFSGAEATLNMTSP